MADRLELQAILESILGSTHVYFQPPPNIQMQYPCIVYNRDAADAKHADSVLYAHTQRYHVTVIARDPDHVLPMQIANLPLCRFDRFYTADNLNHDAFTLFF